ncbi:unnamed protein product [Blepharisma stoltei]|uniref:Uncharacterized protein n=1 Tax=Blepharisma stoltei TaxID=1481888 RepID=A0AAU9JZC4_9CILI|nr:unnamed protein product [Blepharisma stoltei]
MIYNSSYHTSSNGTPFFKSPAREPRDEDQLSTLPNEDFCLKDADPKLTFISILSQNTPEFNSESEENDSNLPDKEVCNFSKNSDPAEVLSKVSKHILASVQEALTFERKMMLDIVNEDSKRDWLVYELSKKLDSLHRENILLAHDNKSLKGIVQYLDL